MVKIRIERIQIDVNVTFRSFIRIFQKISNNDAMHLCAARYVANMQQRAQLPRDYDEDEFIVCLRADWSEYT